MSSDTAGTFKGRSIDAKEIGKELGVRYVLEGSVQRDQNRVRVNAQLVDTETGAVWADRFEENIADLFKLQDQVVARLPNTLGYELIRAEAAKGSRSANPDVSDLAMQGWTLFWRAAHQTPHEGRETAHEARALFLHIDPNDADSLVGSAFTYYADYINDGAIRGPTMKPRCSRKPTKRSLRRLTMSEGTPYRGHI